MSVCVVFDVVVVVVVVLVRSSQGYCTIMLCIKIEDFSSKLFNWVNRELEYSTLVPLNNATKKYMNHILTE